jgi:hypothetical protein
VTGARSQTPFAARPQKATAGDECRRAATTSTRAESVLALQRLAGNRATQRRLSRTSVTGAPAGPGRVLQRCAGGCTCGGSCGTRDPELEDTASAQLRRAVSARAGAH